MKTPRLVMQWHEQQADACRLKVIIKASLKELGYGWRFLV